MAKWAIKEWKTPHETALEFRTHSKERFIEPPERQHEMEDEKPGSEYHPLDKRIYPDIDYKFNEANLIKEFKDYINSTYSSHYSRNGFQSTEIIVERGHGTGFCMGNIDKYSNRYGKKGNYADQRKDLIKIMHYALIQLSIHDKNE